MAATETPVGREEDEDPEEYRQRVGASFEEQPKPTAPCTYMVEEAAYWECRHLPVGSVIAFDLEPGADPLSEAIAVLVKDFRHDKHGTWADVKFIGAKTAELAEEGRRRFRSKMKRIHICRIKRDSEDNYVCPVMEQDGTHLERFRWYPPGDFDAEWLTPIGRKAVKSGLKMYHDSEVAKEKEKRGDGGKSKGPSSIEKRLAALRSRHGGDPKVTFGSARVVPLEDGGLDGDSTPFGGGTTSKAPPSRRAQAGPPAITNGETNEGEKDRSASGKKNKSRNLDEELVAAASSSKVRETEEKRSRSRSRRRRKKKKKKRKKEGGGSPSSSDSSGSSSSSSKSLMAPLKRKAERSPGSVYKMLEDQARSHLAQDGVLDEDGPSTQRPRMFTYFQISLRPHLDPKSRDAKEMAMLARALDLLRSGRLTALADLLAARLIAVDTATRQGWSTARHLEVFGMEEEATAPPHILLAAQRHSRQVDRAGGKASWSRGASWSKGDWGAGQEKGKGKRWRRREDQDPTRGIRLKRSRDEPPSLDSGVITAIDELIKTAAEGSELVLRRAHPLQKKRNIDDRTETNSMQHGDVPVGCAEPLNSGTPQSDREWFEALGDSCTLKELGFKLAWGWQHGYLQNLLERAGPTQPTPYSKGGGLFPLPLWSPAQLAWTNCHGPPTESLEGATECWLLVCAAALNWYSGHRGHRLPTSRKKIHAAVRVDLTSKIQRLLARDEHTGITLSQVATELRERRISYTGEEVSQPLPLTVEQIIGGLPPVGHGGSIDVMKFLRGRTRFLLEHPTENMVPMKDRPEAPIQSRVHIQKGEELKVFELLRERGIIEWVTGEQSTTAWWQVYLDNFLSGERTSLESAGLAVALQVGAMEAWEAENILTAKDKNVAGEKTVVELGVRIDGELGLLGASTERLFKTSLASLHLLKLPWWNKRVAQVVLGRWVFILQFRRAGMAVLSRSWEAVEAPSPTKQQIIRLHSEVLALVCLGPLLQCDLTASYDPEVTCSDASERGGACAVATSLSTCGEQYSNLLARSPLQPLELPILVISVFNGIGGAFRLYDVLGVKVMGKISIDICKEANRTTRTTWGDIRELHDINDIDEQEVRRWASDFPRAQQVHLYAGFPCIHLSAVRAFRQNLSGEGSNLFWSLLTLMEMIHRIFSPQCLTKFCVENVASMDDTARKEISNHLEVTPIKFDPSDTLPFNRPRLAWTSCEVLATEELELWREKEYVRAYVKYGTVEDSQWVTPGWTRRNSDACLPTFMKSIKRQQPPPVPAGLRRADEATVNRWVEHEYRFPPYQYGERFLFDHATLPSRLADASERELLLGYGSGHTSSARSASDIKKSKVEFEDIRLTLCGDSFAISSFAIVAAAMCADLITPMSPSRIIRRLGLAPGTSAHPDIEVPMQRGLAYGAPPGPPADRLQLVKQLGLTVNHTGADVRLLTGEAMGPMPRTAPRVVLAGATARQRRASRQGISLRDLSITEKTRQRYLSALGRLLPFLEQHPDPRTYDSVICDWIEYQWARGEALTHIADSLSGLHFYWPALKGTLRQSWRMFRNWRRIEAPARAPPITPNIVAAMIVLAIERNQLAFGVLVAIGFHGLLRTGELLALQFQDIEFTPQCGVLSLKSSKSGLRTGTEEAVAVRDSLTLQLLHTLVTVRSPYPGDKLWPHSGQHFRTIFANYLHYFQLEALAFKPYSLRRGGATFLLQCGLPIETILVRGRWRSLNVARLYLEDGLAQLPALRLSEAQLALVQKFAAVPLLRFSNLQNHDRARGRAKWKAVLCDIMPFESPGSLWKESFIHAVWISSNGAPCLLVYPTQRISPCIDMQDLVSRRPSGLPPWSRVGQWYGWEAGPITSKHYAHVTPMRGHFAWQKGWGPQGQQELWASDMFGFHPEADMHWSEADAWMHWSCLWTLLGHCWDMEEVLQAVLGLCMARETVSKRSGLWK
eukprot:Skav235069  [mRNA]  locus=scaffold3466:36062:45450:- [translate_table: standard]